MYRYICNYDIYNFDVAPTTTTQGHLAPTSRFPDNAQRHVTWGGKRGEDSEDDGRKLEGGEEEKEEAVPQGPGRKDTSGGKEVGGDERRKGSKGDIRSKVMVGASQIAPSYLIPAGADDDKRLLRGGGGAPMGIAAVGRDGRLLGLGASLPAAIWQEWRKGSAFGASHGTSNSVTHATSHGIDASAHAPYARTNTHAAPTSHILYSSGAGSAYSHSTHTHTHAHTPNPYTAMWVRRGYSCVREGRGR